MEKRVVELEVKDNTKSLKAQLKEAQAEVQTLADKYGATSAAAVEAAKRAADLKDRIGDAKALTDAFNPDAKFKALSSSLSGVAGGFSAVTGAMGLMGAESEDVQKLMLKVQSAMALSQGLQALGEAKDSFKQLGAVVTNTFKGLSSESSLAGKATSALGPIWKAVGVSGKSALTGIRAGIAATGIGLLVLALGAVVAYWDDIKAAVGGVSSELKKNVELSKKQVKNAEDQVELAGLNENSLRLQGKSEKEILQIRKGKLTLLVKEQEEDIKLAENKKKLEVAASKRNKDMLMAYLKLNLEAVLLPFRLVAIAVDGIMGTVNMGLKAVGASEIKYKSINSYLTDFKNYAADGLAGLIFDPAAVAAESNAEIAALKTAVAKTKSEIAGTQIEIQDINKASDKKQADNKKEADQSMTEYLDALEADRKAKITDAKEKELQDLADHYDLLYAAADKAGQDTKELQKKNGEEVTAINKKYADLAAKEKAEAEAKAVADMKTLEDKANADRIAKQQLFIDAMAAGPAKELAIKKLALDNDLVNLQNQLDNKLIELDEYNTLAKQKGDEFNAEKKKSDEQIAGEEKAIRDQKIQLTADAFSAIDDMAQRSVDKYKALNDEVMNNDKLSEAEKKKMVAENNKRGKRAFEVQKAASIASTLASTYLSAQQAYLSQFTPVPDPSSPIRGGIAAGIAVAGGLANVAKIARQKFEGGTAESGGSGGGGGSTPGGGGAPNFNVVGNNGINQLAQLQQQPIQAYVVGSQVTTQQALDRNRVDNGQL